jgi:hypothetical protein
VPENAEFYMAIPWWIVVPKDGAETCHPYLYKVSLFSILYAQPRKKICFPPN